MLAPLTVAVRACKSRSGATRILCKADVPLFTRKNP